MARQIQRVTLRTFHEGMPLPPLRPGLLRLYSMRFCPYAQRTRLVLAHKNIPYETININLRRKPSWLLEKNPKGGVPVLEHGDGRVLFESVITSQYLDEIYPDHPLTPSDPYQKYKDQLLVDYCDKFMIAMYELLRSSGQSQEAKSTLLRGLHIYEQELQKRGNQPFFGGDKPALLDYLLWPWFERMPMLNLDLKEDSIFVIGSDDNKESETFPLIDLSASLYPRLQFWMSNMVQLPAVKATMFDLKTHLRFAHSQLTEEPEYDMGLDHEPPLPVHTARL